MKALMCFSNNKAKYIVTDQVECLGMKPFQKLVVKVLKTVQNPIKDFNPFDFLLLFSSEIYQLKSSKISYDNTMLCQFIEFNNTIFKTVDSKDKK